MPYIDQEDRIIAGFTSCPRNVGELNYLITVEIQRILNIEESYARYSEIIGIVGSFLYGPALDPDHEFDAPEMRNLYLYINEWLTIGDFPGSENTVKASVNGTLLCVILELYRRKIALYEDLKIEENGDVYFYLGKDKP